VAGLVLAMSEYQVRGADVKWLAWGLTLVAGLTMVSNLRFYSGKDINLRKSVPFSAVVAIALGFVLLISFAGTLPEMLFALFMAYGLSGYALWVYDKFRRRPPSEPPAAG
jgi:CDP-diacylglycerol--serine O-phosphatidyltransferase